MRIVGNRIVRPGDIGSHILDSVRHANGLVVGLQTCDYAKDCLRRYRNFDACRGWKRILNRTDSMPRCLFSTLNAPYDTYLSLNGKNKFWGRKVTKCRHRNLVVVKTPYTWTLKVKVRTA